MEISMSIYDTLNEQQREAVFHTEGPVLILAGAGSGKTRVLTHRTAYLIEEKGVNPYNIMAITFTNKAAGEMRERIDQLVGYGSESIWVSTFHSTCVRILRRHIDRIGFDTNFTIYDSDDQKTLMKDICKRLNVDTKIYKERSLLAAISKAKDELVDPQEFSLRAAASGDFAKRKQAEIYREYQDALRRNNALDFDDLIVKTVELFKTDDQVLDYYQERFRYIMVDEYQDTNTAQFELISILARKYKNLCVVGDDDQSIYHFRGAHPEIMLNFPEDFKNAETVILNINYRCSGNILDTAMKVIDHNENRYVKKLSTPNEPGEPVQIKEFRNPRDEYMAVAGLLRNRMEEGDNIEDTALLFRTNQEAEGLVAALMEYGVPFTMKEKLPNLFRHWICRNMIAYLKMAEGDRSRSTFLEIMNRPNRYIARDALTEKNIDFKALGEFYKDKDWMCDRITTMETHLRILKTMAPYAAINFIRNGMGYEEYLQEYARYRKIKPEELMETLNRIHESARGMKTLEEWMAYMDEYTRKLEEQAKKQDVKREGVVISTLHAVKGLEYDNVYIMNVNEGSMPYRKAVLEAHLEEERRLFYVGMTRAKKKLCLYYVRQQYEKEREPSRFLEEAGL